MNKSAIPFLVLLLSLSVFLMCSPTDAGGGPTGDGGGAGDSGDSGDGNVVITFEDENLEQAVREEISKPTGDIHVSDVSEITCLNANDRGITSLGGIEHLTSLEELYFYRNKIVDISSLSGLTNLTILDLYKNQVKDISSLSGLTKVSVLNVAYNEISSVSSLSGLTNLTELYLFKNKITDVGSLSGLTNLRILDLYSNQVAHISCLNALTKLTKLDITFNGMVINFEESVETAAGKNAKAIKDHVDHGCNVIYNDGNAVTGSPSL